MNHDFVKKILLLILKTKIVKIEMVKPRLEWSGTGTVRNGNGKGNGNGIVTQRLRNGNGTVTEWSRKQNKSERTIVRYF